MALPELVWPLNKEKPSLKDIGWEAYDLICLTDVMIDEQPVIDVTRFETIRKLPVPVLTRHMTTFFHGNKNVEVLTTDLTTPQGQIHLSRGNGDLFFPFHFVTRKITITDYSNPDTVDVGTIKLSSHFSRNEDGQPVEFRQGLLYPSKVSVQDSKKYLKNSPKAFEEARSILQSFRR